MQLYRHQTSFILFVPIWFKDLSLLLINSICFILCFKRNGDWGRHSCPSFCYSYRKRAFVSTVFLFQHTKSCYLMWSLFHPSNISNQDCSVRVPYFYSHIVYSIIYLDFVSIFTSLNSLCFIFSSIIYCFMFMHIQPWYCASRDY